MTDAATSKRWRIAVLAFVYLSLFVGAFAAVVGYSSGAEGGAYLQMNWSDVIAQNELWWIYLFYGLLLVGAVLSAIAGRQRGWGWKGPFFFALLLPWITHIIVASKSWKRALLNFGGAVATGFVCLVAFDMLRPPSVRDRLKTYWDPHISQFLAAYEIVSRDTASPHLNGKLIVIADSAVLPLLPGRLFAKSPDEVSIVVLVDRTGGLVPYGSIASSRYLARSSESHVRIVDLRRRLVIADSSFSSTAPRTIRVRVSTGRRVGFASSTQQVIGTDSWERARDWILSLPRE